MASYDDQVNKSYVLEHGDYEITLNTDAHTVVDSKTVTVEKTSFTMMKMTENVLLIK